MMLEIVSERIRRRMVTVGLLALLLISTCPATAAPIAGDYALLPGQNVAIRLQGERWTCAIADGKPRTMESVDGQTYRVNDSCTILEFSDPQPTEPAALKISSYGQTVVAPRLDRDRPVASSPRAYASTVEQLDDLIPRLMILHRVPGVSVVGVEDHALAWHREYGVREAGTDRKVDRNTLFEACSMTKPVFAYAVLQLVEQGRLDLDKPLVEYLDKPYLTDDPRHRKITARMVLCHTCGFPNWRKQGEALRVTFEPGSKFQYSGEGFKYLQHVVERITGTRLDRWMRKAVLDPVGMKTSSFAWEKGQEDLVASGHDNDGKVKRRGPRFLEANSAASLLTSPTEYAMFQLEMMRRDRSANHSLKQKTIAEMLTRMSKTDSREPIKRRTAATSNDVHFGLGWQINATPLGDRFFHGGTNGGGFRCYNEFDPRRGSGFVIMTNGLSGDKLWEAVVEKIAP